MGFIYNFQYNTFTLRFVTATLVLPLHGKNRMRNARGAAKYIGRYVSRPAIAESRIIGYDGKTVTFWYERHDNGQRVVETLPVLEFIGKVVRHVPERHFKMVRYYGIYSRTKKSQAQKIMSVWKKYKRLAYKRIYWRERIVKSFGLDPLVCPKCGKEMEVYDIFYEKYGSLLKIMERRMQEAYEKEEAELRKNLFEGFEGGDLYLYGM